MNSIGDMSENPVDWPGRWNFLKTVLARGGPFSHPDFEPSEEILTFLLDTCKILVIGAGGLGCELLKDLALMGFRHIDVIDMDTIDLSNLNRQFLFRKGDIGKPKAEVAATFINARIPGCCVTPHFCKIQDFDGSFYKQFHIIVCGLDSIIARRWINGMLANFPLCTIAHTPRLPEHCVEYVRLLLWPQQKPYGEETAIDGDDPEHIKWIYDKSMERADQFGITGLTYRLTQGVVKRIIPAVASTNAVIAAACATEVFKIASSCCQPLNNFVNFSDTDGVYTYSFEAERRDDCPACSRRPQTLVFTEDAKLQELVDYLKENPAHQLKSPGIVTVVDGNSKTLYMQTVKSIEEATRPNLKMSFKELKLHDGQEIYVADPTTPNSLPFRLKLTSKMDDS